jgi:hypothetical protein
MTIETLNKSLRCWVSVSSGKKRKELDIFHDKDNKSLGGIKALFWIKRVILEFPNYFDKMYDTSGLNVYLCIGWADNRRRNIYSRLEKEGFYFMNIDNQKVLIKQIENE